MSKVSDIVANVLSVVLYPLFIPTYGMGLFCYAYSRQSVLLPPVWMAVAIVGTFLLTCAIPLSAIWIMIRKGPWDVPPPDAPPSKIPCARDTL